MRVTGIESHEITLEYVDWISWELTHYQGIGRRTVYVAHTDSGETGLGEGRSEPPEVIEQYIGSNPFDWLGDETSLPIGTAMYDLMGKAAGMPVYKLFGQKHRSWVPVGSWTVSTHPERMAEAVRRYSRQGYTWLKFHLSPFENVFDQTEAIMEVAPRGFRIHYDFTGGGTIDHMPDLLERLSRYPVAGCFEDSIDAGDTLASIALRKRIRLPIVRHQAPLDCTCEVLARAGDVYMRGHQKIGDAIRAAGLFAAGNIPFMLQNVGGTITRAMTAHMTAAFPTATFHFFNDTETWRSDVVRERLEPVNGFVRVPEKPGLGLTLDRGELERLARLEAPVPAPWIVRSKFDNGTRMYNVAAGKGHFMVRPDWTRGGIPMSYDAPITTDYWDDDGTEEFRQMYARIEREGLVIERPEAGGDSLDLP